MVGRVNAVSRGVKVVSRAIREFITFAADDCAAALAETGKDAEKCSREQAVCGLRFIFGRHQRDADAAENDQPPQSLSGRRSMMQPEPLDKHAERCGEALDEDNRPSRTDARVSLKHGKIPDAETDATAEEQNRKCPASEAKPEQMRERAKHSRGENQTREIRLCAADVMREPPSTDCGEREKNCCEKSGQHARSVEIASVSSSLFGKLKGVVLPLTPAIKHRQF